MAHVSESLTPASPTRGTPDGPLLPSRSSTALERPVVAVPPMKKELTKRQRNYRKPPKDSRVYKAVMAYIALKAQGVRLAEIAEMLHLSKDTVSTYVKRANKKGWINLDNFDDPEDQLEIVLKSKAVRNINTFLDETDDETGKPTAACREVTLEVAKGTGMLKAHQVVKSDGGTNVGVALKVTVEMPPSGTTPQIRAGSIGGQPAFDAEIIEGDKA